MSERTSPADIVSRPGLLRSQASDGRGNQVGAASIHRYGANVGHLQVGLQFPRFSRPSTRAVPSSYHSLALSPPVPLP